MGRNSKYTEALQEQICSLIARGNRAHVAASVCGIHQATHYRWLQMGEAGQEPYRDYCEAVKKAENEAEQRFLTVIEEAATDGFEVTKTKTVEGPKGTEVTETVEEKRSWQAAAWWLERQRGYSKPLTIDEAVQLLAQEMKRGNSETAKKLGKALGVASPEPVE